MSLQGRRILVVEDDRQQGEALCRALRDAGCVVLGPAPTSFYASQLLGRRHVDAAVLDSDLYGRPVFELASILERRNIPFLFMRDGAAERLPASYRGRPCLNKPVEVSALLSALRELPGIAPARPAFPLPFTTAERGISGSDAQTRIVRTICRMLRSEAPNAWRAGSDQSLPRLSGPDGPAPR